MKPRITLVHGWSYDASIWREVLPLLNGLDVEAADLGFFGKSALPQLCDAPRIAVGHSLGVLWWLALTDLPWAKLVAINGFPRFTAAADFPAGVAPRVLERMIKRFAVAPAAVLADFHTACGGAGPDLPADPAPLAAGLRTLGEADGRAVLATRLDDVLALAARDDAIVPAALSEAAFGPRLEWLPQGSHLLPLTHPQACARLIRRAVDSL
ncbi:MAG: alpha/beta hydrolase [Sterolibacteriaceae bacterium MAG5]|nr:alpha/beta hydrolase [Candidatus Nitricoxidireducens bremensis]